MVTETESVVVSSSAVVPITSVVVYGFAEKITKIRYYFFKLSSQPSESGSYNRSGFFSASVLFSSYSELYIEKAFLGMSHIS